jgi:DNA-binding LytR/AlgR family response regulator
MNKIYTCVIIEDSLIDRKLLVAHTEKISNIDIKAVFEDGLKALNFLSENEIDIVISDIEMPNLKGIELIKVLKTTPRFIFTTSHLGFAVEGFELNAIDYIVKPVTFPRLERAVHKAIEFSPQNKNKSNTEISDVINPQEDHFFIRENHCITKIFNDDVLYIESMSDFSKIIMVDGKVQIVLASLKIIEEQLPANQFKRVHRKFIINFNKISTIALNEVILEGKLNIPMGSSYKQTLMVNINNKILSRT